MPGTQEKAFTEEGFCRLSLYGRASPDRAVLEAMCFEPALRRWVPCCLPC